MDRLPPSRRAAKFIGRLAHVLGLVVAHADPLATLVGGDEELAGKTAQRLVGKVDRAGRGAGSDRGADYRRDRARRAHREDAGFDRLVEPLAAREGVARAHLPRGAGRDLDALGGERWVDVGERAGEAEARPLEMTLAV